MVSTEAFDGQSLRCIGSFSQDGGFSCLESPKRHSLYCEKHLPSWLKRARNGKSRIISKEVFIDILNDCHSLEEKLKLHQACELFYRVFKSILSLRNPVPMEIQIQWVKSEASKDMSVGKFLLKLVSREVKRLVRLFGFGTDNTKMQKSLAVEPVMIPTGRDGELDNGSIIRCNICAHKFSNDQELSTHWMNHHRKEAQWLFRGYVCALCLDSFTNKKVLEAHVQDRHHAQYVEQCMLFQCIPCGGHFGNNDQLWSHVLSNHPTNFRLSKSVQPQNASVVDNSGKKIQVKNNVSSENQGDLRKFVCRFCGLKFDLLPDLGRHHQAAHMGLNSNGHRHPTRNVVYYAHKLKSGRLAYYAHKLKPGRLGRTKFKKSLGAASYKIRKKRIHAPISIGSAEVEVQSRLPDAASLGRLVEPQCSAVANLLYSELKKTKRRPSNHEILALARSACCKSNLQSLLVQKYGLLPERLYLKAAKLCSDHNIEVEWQQEGFVCPKECTPVTESHLVAPLTPLLDGVESSTSVAPTAVTAGECAIDEGHYIIDFHHSMPEAVQKSIILCEDISFGQESVPIACAVDENLLGSLQSSDEGPECEIGANSFPWEGFSYVRKPIFDQAFNLEVEDLQLGCACVNLTCSSDSCDHVYLFNNDFEDAKDICGKPMKGRSPYDEKGRILLEEGYFIYECNQNCQCSRTCQNRVLQNGVRVKLEVFKTEEKGWGVRAGEVILRGTFVCEYVGEVIDEQEANNRRNRYGRKGCGYLFEIDGHVNDMSQLFEGKAPDAIDATNYGNVSRYINHSCSPNLLNHQVLVESMDCRLAHVGLYASRDIALGEELTFDYKYKIISEEGTRCHCGASNCRGRLH